MVFRLQEFADALIPVAHVLVKAELAEESLILAVPDFKHAFDSLVHKAIFLQTPKRGDSLSIIRVLRKLYP